MIADDATCGSILQPDYESEGRVTEDESGGAFDDFSCCYTIRIDSRSLENSYAS